jgi:hypothetical protein
VLHENGHRHVQCTWVWPPDIDIDMDILKNLVIRLDTSKKFNVYNI